MEALAAVGLAGNVVQFIDFGCKLFSTARQIRNSSNGLTDDLDNIQTITTNLIKFCTDLQTSLNNRPVATQDGHIACLGAQCLKVAQRPLDAVVKLQAKKGSPSWNSFQAALKAVWKQKEIDRMAKQLNDLRMELILRQQFDTLKVLEEMKETNVSATESRRLFTAEFRQLRTRISQLDPHQQPLLRSGLSKTHDTPLLDEASRAENYLLDLSTIVKSLHFEGMRYRYSNVTAAHSKTYGWAFDNHFAAFLRSAKTMFWVSGKPGSGKSTFMKFVLNSSKAMTCLQEWADQRTLIVSNYFFWVNGNPRQRSQEGLLRSIVLDILLQCPHLRSVALTFVQDLRISTWNLVTGSLLKESWDLLRLSELLKLLLARSRSSYRFAFFIDGLDEYDGRPLNLIGLLTSLRVFDNVKMCIASRPWNEFEGAFGADESCKLYMHELTHDDIKTFAADTLGQNAQFQNMISCGDDVGPLIQEITTAAQGVFLWVRLVVQSLLTGLQNADRAIDLQRRVAEYPRDLDEFFRYMFDSVEPVYRGQVAKDFKVLDHAIYEALGAFEFWYLDREDEDPDYALEDNCPPAFDIEDLSKHRREEGARLSQVKKRVAGRFKGLLEVTEMSRYKGAKNNI